ncbi:putative RNase H-like nuclease [Ochrobactrum intermedium]|uniref:RNase H-like nuclease n=1 Tax=Brucella intermedia TaxID=94625 RepID=A0ABR6AWP0_9HYPH|nr:DUF429 domain-containing protein [Brucella intermedia]MBA8853802.1 putative RNase H-like nuclease [Brucella intermedia]MCO7739291.1 DUF429 domain-containing protein [Brucella intermedia]
MSQEWNAATGGTRAAVIGIDAAWTLRQPSGVALAVLIGNEWQLRAVAPSYQRFQALADECLVCEPKPLGRTPDVSALLQAGRKLAAAPIDIVAIDMPLSNSPIVGRRRSDDAVSRAYGSRKCSTHSPSDVRPGVISDTLRTQAEGEGYALATETIFPRALIEVYPHPALVELACAAERLPYKAQKARKYWPSINAQQRRENLLLQWYEIVSLLEAKISGVGRMLPPIEPKASAVELKAFEDMLDAIVCCWVAICALQGRAIPFGDDTSAIWIPTPLASMSNATPALGK